MKKCQVCGHGWSRHDPEDGRCDAGQPPAISVEDWQGPKHNWECCPCGRDLEYHAYRNAELARQTLNERA